MISSAAEISKEWLGEVLQAQVAQVTARQNPAFNSSVTHLELTYAGGTTLPGKVLVKLNQGHDGQNEIQFYRFGAHLDLPMIPRLLAAGYDAQDGRSFLLLEDISESHTAPVTREQLIALDGVPADAQLASAAGCLAGLHAAFWEHPRFGTIPDTTEMRWWYRDEEAHAMHVERRQLEWARFLRQHQAELPQEWVVLGNRALEKLPGLFQSRIAPRLASRRALTISQGDCYLSQFLLPRTGSGNGYLIDFQDTSVNFPAYDLV